MQIVLWILLLLLSAAAGFIVYKADKRRSTPYPWLTALLRTLVVGLTLLLLIAPMLEITRTRTEKPVVVFLQDNSSSVPLALKDDTARYKQDATQLLASLRKEYRVVTWGFGKGIERDTLFRYQQPATNIQEALAQAVAFYGQQNLGAVVLATDGQYNEGANPQFADLGLSAPLYTVALGDSTLVKDLRIWQVYANKTVAANSQFEIRADILATGCNGYTGNATLRDAGTGQSQNVPVSIATNRFDKSIAYTLRAEKPGLHHYILELPSAEGEANTINNRRDVFVEVVSEKKQILLAAAAPHPDIQALREALSGMEQYELVVRTANQLPASLADYDVLIFHGLPSQQASMQSLATMRKPMWFILSSTTYATFLNGFQQAAVANINPLAQQPVYAMLPSGFSLFNLPPQVNAVMDKMPPLSVPVGTFQPGANATVLLHARGNAQQPLWLLSQGARPSALLAGEGIWRWRMAEYRNFSKHEVVDELIRQTVTFLAANAQEKPFNITLPKYVWSDGEAISINAYVLNVNNEQINTPDVTLTVSDSAGNKQTYSFERSGTAYRLNLGLQASGNYSYTAQTTMNGKPMIVTGSFAVQQTPVEMMKTSADYPLLYALARKHQGALFPYTRIQQVADSIRNNQSIKPLLQTSTESIPLVDWKWFFVLILVLAIVEWLLRKYWMAQ